MVMHKLLFVLTDGKRFGVWRSVLEPDSSSCTSTVYGLESLLQDIKGHKSWVVMLLTGGHFAAAVFQRVEKEGTRGVPTIMEPVVHKTLHRYVVR